MAKAGAGVRSGAFRLLGALAAVVLAGCAAPGSSQSDRGTCYRDSCCDQPAALVFAPHRLRCEALAARNAERPADAERKLQDAIAQASAAPADRQRDANEVLCFAHIDAARLANRRGEDKQTLERFTRATPLCERAFGSKSDEYGHALAGLVNATQDAGRYDEVAPSLVALTDISRQSSDKTLRAAALDALARNEEHAGDHRKARELLRQSLDLHQQTTGDRSLESATTMVYLGDNAMAMHDWAGAKGWYLRGLDVFEVARGKRNASYITIKTALAASMLRGHQIDGLAAIYEDLLSLTRTVYGPRSDEYVGTLNDAAALQYMQRQYPAAFDRFRQATEIRRQTMPGSLLLGWTAINAAKARLEIDGCAQAKPFQQEAQAILVRQRQQKSTDPELGDFATELGRFEQQCAARPGSAAPVRKATKRR